MRANFLKSGPTRVAVLGLDGVPYELLVYLINSGVTPNFERIASQGLFRPMHSTLPPISSVAWTSFATGTPPEEHGIMGFTDFRDNSLSLALPSFDDVRAEPIWRQLEQYGLRSVLVNLPFTYPARAMKGALIAGFVAPVMERAVYPRTLIPWLNQMGYRVDIGLEKGRSNKKGLIQDLFDTLRIRSRVILELLKREPWDLFIAVITGTDRLHHFFFDAAYDENHPYHTVFVDYYRMLDEFIGNFMNEIGNDTGFLSLSDHGFERLETQIYLNSLLQRLGFLSYRTPNPTSLEHVNPESMAVALDPTRIYLIHKGRFKESNRPESEAPGIRNRLKDALESITLEDIDLELEGRPGGASVFQEVHDSPVPFNTRFDYRLPDLICLPQKGIDVKAAIGVPYLHGKDIFTGTHTWDNAYLLIRDHHTHRIDYRPNIVEVAGIIRSMFNGRIPVHQRG